MLNDQPYMRFHLPFLFFLHFLLLFDISSSIEAGDPHARGINCLGSSQCSFTTVDSKNIMAEFNSTVYHGPGNTSQPHLGGGPLPELELWYKGEHIVCAENWHLFQGSICLFLDGKNVPQNGVPGFVIKQRINDLLYHGCKFCGSVPVLGNNEAQEAGVLTSNYILARGCQGVCKVKGRPMRFAVKGYGWVPDIPR